MTIIPHFPQYVLLVYMPKDKIIREYIKIKPKGMFFHEAYHPNVNYLIAWFKRHFAERTYQGQLARRNLYNNGIESYTLQYQVKLSLLHSDQR